MNILMPLIAVAIVKGFDLSPAMRIALIAMSVSPVPPILSQKQLKVGGDPDYVFGLLVSAVSFSIFFVPFSIGSIAPWFGVDVAIPMDEIARIVFFTTLIPLASGVVVRYLAPRFADRYAVSLSRAAGVMLLVCLLPIFVVSWPAIAAIAKSGSMTAIILFCALGLAVGHFLGGPSPVHRYVLALATSMRHPGVAIAIGHLGFAQQKTVPAAVLLIVLVGAVASSIYLRMFKPRVESTRPVRWSDQYARQARRSDDERFSA